MNSQPRMLAGLALIVALVALVAAGAYFYAGLEMEGRIQDYGPGIRAIGYARGGAIPTEAEFTEQSRAAAEPLGLEVVDLTVTRREESGRDLGGNLAQKQMGNLGAVRMELVHYDVRATVVAHKWTFSRSGEVAAERTYRKEVTLETPGRRPPPTLPSERAQTRGL